MLWREEVVETHNIIMSLAKASIGQTTDMREAIKQAKKCGVLFTMTMIGAVASHAAFVGRRALTRAFATVGSQIPSVELHS